MIKFLRNIFTKLNWYVVIDGRDNSVTISRKVWLHLKKNVSKDCDEARVFVFKTSLNEFAFMVNHNIEQDTQLCTVQYNEHFKTIGFESLCPSVNRICYEYGLPYEKPIKLPVRIEKTPDGRFYYVLQNGKGIK